jgi:hypothetical protein
VPWLPCQNPDQLIDNELAKSRAQDLHRDLDVYLHSGHCNAPMVRVVIEAI